jgi:hypothetical protein
MLRGIHRCVAADRELQGDPDLEDGGLSALGFAAVYNHYGLFEFKRYKGMP